MRVFVNLPQSIEGKEELAKRVADFHATLMVEKIKKLNIDDDSKIKIFSLVLDHFKNKSEDEEGAIAGLN